MAKSLNKASGNKKHIPRVITYEDLKSALVGPSETVDVSHFKNKKDIENMMMNQSSLNYIVSPSDKKDHFNVAVRDQKSGGRIFHYSIKIDPANNELSITENNSFFKKKSSSVYPLTPSPFTQSIDHLASKHGSTNRVIHSRLQQKPKPEINYGSLPPRTDPNEESIQYSKLSTAQTTKPISKTSAIMRATDRKQEFEKQYPNSASSAALIAETLQALKKEYAERFHLNVKDVNISVMEPNPGSQNFNITAKGNLDIQVILNKKDMEFYRDNKAGINTQLPDFNAYDELKNELSKRYQKLYGVQPTIEINLYGFGNKVQANYTISYNNQVENLQFNNESAAKYLAQLKQQAPAMPPHPTTIFSSAASTPQSLVAKTSEALKNQYAKEFNLKAEDVIISITDLKSAGHQFNIAAKDKPDIQVILNQKDMEHYSDSRKGISEIPKVDVFKALETELRKKYQEEYRVLPKIELNVYGFGNKVQVDYTISYNNKVEHRQFSNEGAAKYLAQLTQQQIADTQPPRGPGRRS